MPSEDVRLGPVRKVRPPRPSGFTLIELLIVISFIGLLVALALPAVQSAREAARRTACVGNLRQVGMALHNYHSAHACFPINWRGDLYSPHGFPRGTIARPFSAYTRLLPYLDQGALYSHLNFATQTLPRNDQPFPFPENYTVNSTRLAVLLCPSDTQAPARPWDGGCSYRGNYGIGPSAGTTAETFDSGNGFYTLRSVLSAGSFPDGLAHTAAYSERLRGSGRRRPQSPERDFGEIRVAQSCTTASADYALDCCRLAAVKGFPEYVYAGHSWFLGDFECAAYNHAQEPNGRIPDAITMNEWDGIVTARSSHPGGVSTLMGDGSVRFVSQGISRRIWRGLGTRNGDELIE